jgi:hypothetical protein
MLGTLVLPYAEIGRLVLSAPLANGQTGSENGRRCPAWLPHQETPRTEPRASGMTPQTPSGLSRSARTLILRALTIASIERYLQPRACAVRA